MRQSTKSKLVADLRAAAKVLRDYAENHPVKQKLQVHLQKLEQSKK